MRESLSPAELSLCQQAVQWQNQNMSGRYSNAERSISLLQREEPNCLTVHHVFTNHLRAGPNILLHGFQKTILLILIFNPK